MPSSDGDVQRGLNSSGDRATSHGLAVLFGDIARTLQDETSLDDTLHAIVKSAVASIEGADYAAITLVTGAGKLSTPAASDPIAVQVDRVQYETQQGPCLSAIGEQATFRADDLRTEDRWPLFTGRAVELGVLSMLCLQLYVRERELGALNLYSTAVDAFTAGDEDTGLLFATHAAVALIGAQHEHHLHRQQINADLIGQAKGILMERHQLTADNAFRLLAKASQNTNRRLADIAFDVASTGQEPSDTRIGN